MVTLLTVLLLASPTTEALPQSGPVQVGKQVPWFSGWTPDNRVLNRTRLLKDADARAFVLVLFARWCKPCERGLKMIAKRRADLKNAGIRLVLVGYQEDPAKVMPWLKARGLQGERLLIDRFGVATAALGGVQKTESEQTATLPRTVVMTREGKVVAIFGKEGPDYVDRILAATR